MQRGAQIIWVISVLLGTAACSSQAQEQSPRGPARTDARKADAEMVRKGAPPKSVSADADAPTGEPRQDKAEKDKRGNTPPGKDRAGDGPAAGAIVDPQGATQK